MGNIFTLDSLREELENEYAPIKIPLSNGVEAVLPSILRLDKATRKNVTKALKEIDKFQDSKPDDLDGMEDLVRKVLNLVAGEQGSQLLTDLGDDLALTMRVFSRWMEGSQPGEAPGSPS
ncbi:phage tail assembly protein [Nocardia sp. IFM 10818]